MKILDVVLADDHPAILAGLRAHACTLPSIRIVGEVVNSTTLTDLLQNTHCDVLITDYAMPGGRFGDGLQLLEFIHRRYPNIAVIVYTAIDNPVLLDAMYRRGALAIFSKMESVERVAATVRSLAEGTYQPNPVSPATVAKQPADIEKLTCLEAEIVRLFVGGLSIDEIAKQRNRTKQTISAQKQNAKRKLNIARDIDLVRFVKENGFVTLSEVATKDTLDK